MAAHRAEYRVYYEDTDMAGLVYHANHLKFMERGRSDMVRARGIDQARMLAAGRMFAVARVEIDYLSPARFGELLEVETRVLRAGAARLELAQALRVAGRDVARAAVRLVCLDTDGRARRIPAEVRAALAETIQN